MHQPLPAVYRAWVERGECRVSPWRQLARARCRGRQPLRAALDLRQCRSLSLRPQSHRCVGALGGWPSRADGRHAAGQHGSGQRVPARTGSRPLKVAAIVNWFGISDVDDLLRGPDRKTYAVEWVGADSDRESIAKEVSAAHLCAPRAPAHHHDSWRSGPTVPYSQAVRLQKALDAAQVPNELVTIPEESHGQLFRRGDAARLRRGLEVSQRSRARDTFPGNLSERF